MKNRSKGLGTRLGKLQGCYQSQRYASRFHSAQEAWNKCKRADWLLWLAGRVQVPSRVRVRAVLPLVEKAVPMGVPAASGALGLVKRWLKSHKSVDTAEINDALDSLSAGALGGLTPTYDKCAALRGVLALIRNERVYGKPGSATVDSSSIARNLLHANGYPQTVQEETALYAGMADTIRKTLTWEVIKPYVAKTEKSARAR